MGSEINAIKYSDTTNIPFLVGVLLGVNAIRDSAILVDGPDCIFFKSEIIDMNHDKFSSLRSSSRNQKVFFTNLTTRNIVKGHEKFVYDKISEISKNRKINTIFLSSMPMAKLTGVQYEKIINESEIQQKIINVNLFEDRDWLEGYEEFLLSIAKNIDYSSLNLQKNKIGIVGNMYDRNEGDCIGNIRELRNLLNLIGLEAETIWLSGGDFEDLERIKNCEYVVKLPYGRKAADYIAKETGAKLIETSLPFGPYFTKKFLLDVYEGVYGRQLDENTSKKIKNEINTFLEKAKPFIKKDFLGKTLLYSGDPNFFNGIGDFASLLGLDVLGYIGYCRKNKNYYDEDNKEIKSKSYFGKTYYYINKQFSSADIDYFVGNSLISVSSQRSLIFSFPSLHSHFLNEKPFLGFKGAENFLERLVNLSYELYIK
ncbi:nitrogenase component 1 [Candidatus Absconditicoccus praedator]|uniref:nitrogenase component 1 n=1 Tax=Candidatus Absconditicoccus praedator TaxID=2735562 RepID=UPI001E4E1F29|nr:nitrogenase component 1 [Candidatus Absconditicoccus praedator]UFX83313.1 hypothetical protein HLG78_04250 [Candidatus Absconditicoccus praedator]